MPTPCALIQTEDLDGPTNMALDEVLWTEAARGTPFLRLYGWSDRPVLSLGYFQCADDVRSDARLRKLPFVRRLTGGGAIVHDQEITYSLAIPARLAPPTNTLYDRVHRAIAASLVEIGIQAEVSDDTYCADKSDRLCFCRSDRFAVQVRGVKVLGSAQRRRPESVLVHGSLLLARSPAAPQVLGLREILDSDFCVESLRHALGAAIAASLNLVVQPSELPENLRLRAAMLADSKYRTGSWNHRMRPNQTRIHHDALHPEPIGPLCQLSR